MKSSGIKIGLPLYNL